MAIERLVAGENVTIALDGRGATISAAGAPPGSGEANTASDAAASGVGLFHQKSGVDLQFKKLYSPVGGNVAIAASVEEPRVEITVPNATTLGRGAVQLAADLGTGAGTVVQANDGRLSNARTPTAHTHGVGDIASVTDVRLIGRSAGSAGAAQEITVGAGLSLAAGALTATGGPGSSLGGAGPVVLHHPHMAASAAATNLAGNVVNAVSDPAFRQMCDLRGYTKVRIQGRFGGTVAAATKIRIQYHIGGNVAVLTGDGGWTILADSAGSHVSGTMFYSAEIAVPAGAQINNVLIRCVIFSGDGAADPTITCCILNFYT